MCLNEKKSILEKKILENEIQSWQQTTQCSNSQSQLQKTDKNEKKNTDNGDEDQKEASKMEKNRKRARETRKRKKQYIQLLEQKIQMMQNLDSSEVLFNEKNGKQKGGKQKVSKFQYNLMVQKKDYDKMIDNCLGDSKKMELLKYVLDSYELNIGWHGLNQRVNSQNSIQVFVDNFIPEWLKKLLNETNRSGIIIDSETKKYMQQAKKNYEALLESFCMLGSKLNENNSKLEEIYQKEIKEMSNLQKVEIYSNKINCQMEQQEEQQNQDDNIQIKNMMNAMNYKNTGNNTSNNSIYDLNKIKVNRNGMRYPQYQANRDLGANIHFQGRDMSHINNNTNFHHMNTSNSIYHMNLGNNMQNMSNNMQNVNNNMHSMNNNLQNINSNIQGLNNNMYHVNANNSNIINMNKKIYDNNETRFQQFDDEFFNSTQEPNVDYIQNIQYIKQPEYSNYEQNQIVLNTNNYYNMLMNDFSLGYDNICKRVKDNQYDQYQ